MPTVIQIVSVRRILTGLAFAAVGLVLIAVAVLEPGRIRLRTVAFGALFVVIGGALAVSALRQDACSVCRVPLESMWTSLPAGSFGGVEAAIRSASLGDSAAIPALANLALPAMRETEVASLECEYCPKCESVLRVAAARRKQLPDGATTSHDHTPWVIFAGASVKAILAFVASRNEALTQRMNRQYGSSQ